jgi:hypothetical protein
VISEVESLFLIFVARTDADRVLQDRHDHEGHERGLEQGDADVLQLRDHLRPGIEVPHLAGHVVINARVAKGRVDEKSSAKRPQDAADAVHAERVQGVVILQPGLELRDSEEANDARDAASDKRADRTT